MSIFQRWPSCKTVRWHISGDLQSNSGIVWYFTNAPFHPKVCTLYFTQHYVMHIGRKSKLWDVDTSALGHVVYIDLPAHVGGH